MNKWKKALISCMTVLMLSGPVAAHATKVVIDPGHGGHDPGAIGVNGLYEKVANRDIAQKLRDELEKRGYTAILTSDSDRSMSLQERVDFKEAHNADLFISIHANSYPSSEVSGSLILYYDKNYPQKNYPASPEMAELTPINKQFARTVLDAIVQETGLVDRGIVPSAVYVVRLGTMPSILVETAFLSNPSDVAKLSDPSFRSRVASAIANGVWNFMPIGFTDTYGHWAQEAILRLRDHGIVQGNNNQYAPQRQLSRAEFLAMADRVFNFTAEDLEESFDGDAPLDWDLEESDDGDVPSDVDHEKTDGGKKHLDWESNADDAAENDKQLELQEGDQLNPASYDNVHDELYPSETLNEQERVDHKVARLNEQTGLDQDSNLPNHQEDMKDSDEMLESDYSNGQEESELDEREPSDQEAVEEEPKFVDLDEQHWGFQIVDKAVRLGYLQGYPDGTVRPDEPITRAEVSALFDRIWKKDFEVIETEEFADISKGSWYAKAVYNLRFAGLLLGIQPNIFAPERSMTRAEAAVLFDRYIQYYTAQEQKAQ